jgi:hypothetical protein
LSYLQGEGVLHLYRSYGSRSSLFKISIVGSRLVNPSHRMCSIESLCYSVILTYIRALCILNKQCNQFISNTLFFREVTKEKYYLTTESRSTRTASKKGDHPRLKKIKVRRRLHHPLGVPVLQIEPPH